MNRVSIAVSLLVSLSSGLVPQAFAAPAAPIVIYLQQDDGTLIEAVTRGDEHASWTETLDGYSIIQDRGRWVYAVKGADGQLESSGLKVGTATRSQLAGLSKGVAPEPEGDGPIRAPRRTIAPGETIASRYATSPHTQNVVAILVEFADITLDDYTPSTGAATFSELLFGASGSVADYYDEVSYSNFVVQPATETQGTPDDGIIIVTWEDVTNVALNHPNPGRGDVDSLIQDVMAEADPFIDYSSFDTDGDNDISPEELSIIVIFAGYENSFGGTNAKTPNVWGHQGTISAVTLDGDTIAWYTAFGERHARTSDIEDRAATIGIMAHELGHLMFGLPDLYDVTGGSEGIGDWGLMGGGSWNALNDAGDSPAHLCAWSKITTGMVTPTDYSATSTGETIASGHATADVKRLWVDKYEVRERFLIENRQQSGFDVGLPGNGLMIWHIDEGQLTATNTDNADETHKLVDLEAADGNTDLDDETNQGDGGDPFPGTSNNTTFDDASTPNSKDYSGGATNVAVQNISASSASMTADFVPGTTGGSGDHLRYDEAGAQGWGVGFGEASAWTALNIENTTSLDQIEGFEFYARADATVDFYFYETLSGSTPTTQIGTEETGFDAAPGWNRFLLATPLSFPAASERVMVLRIFNDDQDPGTRDNFPITYDPDGTWSGRSYGASSNAGAYSSLANFGDLNQIALLGSSTVVNVAPTIDAQGTLETDEDTAITVEFTDLTVTDTDNTYPDDFTMTLTDGDNYSVSGQQVTPDPDYHGTLTVPVTVNDGTDDSNSYDLAITVNSVADATAYVDFASVVAPMIGTLSNPYDNLTDGLAGVSSGGTLTVVAGAGTWSGQINQDVRIEASGGTVTLSP